VLQLISHRREKRRDQKRWSGQVENALELAISKDRVRISGAFPKQRKSAIKQQRVLGEWSAPSLSLRSESVTG
jgi:hypothetical protein